MRIVFYQPSLHSQYGGPPKTTIDLARALGAAGHQATLLTFEVGDAALDGAPGLSVAHIAPPTLPFGALAPGRAGAADAAIRGADAFHVMGVFTGANLQLCARARRLGVPYFVSLAGMLDDDCFDTRALRKRAFMAAVGRRWLARAAGVHCTAQDELVQSSRFFDRALGVVIPNFVDVEPFGAEPDAALARARFDFLRGEAPAIVFLGRLHPIKGLDRLIDTCGELKKRGRAFSLVLAGPGGDDYVAQLRRRAMGAGIAGHLHFTGLVSGDLKVSLLRAARVFAMPSFHENFGIALVEALLAGTPAVVTRGVRIWRELEASGGVRIAEGDPASLADALAPYLDDPAPARREGDAVRAWALAFVEPGRIIAQFEAMYADRGGRAPRA